jgi:hypothetical protein
MAEQPLVGSIEGGSTAVAGRDIGTVNITYASGARLERIFAAVPAPGPLLVGREQEISTLRSRVFEGGPLAVSALNGLPGVGKTALALALAYDEATLCHFTGGVLWAGLGSRANVDGVLGLWSTALGVDVGLASTSDDRARLLNGHLQHALPSKPFLLVLDDAWRWEDIAPFRHFTAPGSALLLTTRDATLARRFGRGQPLTVHELSEEAAVDLLAQHSPEALAADPAGMRELAQAVGGLPLALTLIGVELAANAGQPRWVGAALERLRSAEARLGLEDDQVRPGGRQPGRRGDDPRQHRGGPPCPGRVGRGPGPLRAGPPHRPRGRRPGR